MNTRAKGRLGEAETAAVLLQAGFSLLARNLIFYGLTELDLVCNRGSSLFIVEVKSTFTGHDQLILQAMTGRKTYRLRQGAKLFNYSYCGGRYQVELWLAICYFSNCHSLQALKFLPLD